jgi:hypothetical protein
MIYQTCLVLATQFTHANISLPKALDKVVSSFCFAQYAQGAPPLAAAVHRLPTMARCFPSGTAVWHLCQARCFQIRYGLDRYYPNEHDENLLMLLRKPFQKPDP